MKMWMSISIYHKHIKSEVFIRLDIYEHMNQTFNIFCFDMMDAFIQKTIVGKAMLEVGVQIHYFNWKENFQLIMRSEMHMKSI